MGQVLRDYRRRELSLIGEVIEVMESGRIGAGDGYYGGATACGAVNG